MSIKYRKLGDRHSVAAMHDPNEIPRVQQSARDECDINNIMLKYRNGGEIQHINAAQARFGDFSSGQDYTDAYTAIANAEHAFSELPAYIRDMFGNNAETFLYKLEEPGFLEKLEALGVYDAEAGPVHRPIKSAPVLDEEPAPGGPEVPREASDNEAKPPQPNPITGGE